MDSLIEYELRRLARDIGNVHGGIWLALTTGFLIAMAWLYANQYGFFAFLSGLLLINTGAALAVWTTQNYQIRGGQ